MMDVKQPWRNPIGWAHSQQYPPRGPASVSKGPHRHALLGGRAHALTPLSAIPTRPNGAPPHLGYLTTCYNLHHLLAFDQTAAACAIASQYISS